MQKSTAKRAKVHLGALFMQKHVKSETGQKNTIIYTTWPNLGLCAK